MTDELQPSGVWLGVGVKEGIAWMTSKQAAQQGLAEGDVEQHLVSDARNASNRQGLCILKLTRMAWDSTNRVYEVRFQACIPGDLDLLTLQRADHDPTDPLRPH